ncbi:23S rRNA (guanosine(2251)-2'-O)-methyltransferase RlmB [Candidatus Kaiserbacteria bacterium CG10_big_fil_rev_8_21_14_0_10_45_20]|uniref:23S rRNA (Guanosine(2251)-2'-O)-methyltransferase RlmB n=1 Tax=Candidatus Kaiserbacteria bacterium CG10_big_fil_rev_8_21_14_0_10_45_20 TaxID=1974607 RepID=A0A2H0UFG9_9BACT|nr:MAG: 23S rRNA (guanosine(2251)-2'-O)-methyltransferase RlmB [Candidatus Kaiserbacteria bacterium CG10_big_fil_rev_8_21_14_0_10_45_20]
MKNDIVCIYGKHPVEEALRYAPHIIDRVFVDSDTNPEVYALVEKKKVTRTQFSMKDLTRYIGKDAVHQRVAAFIQINKLVTPLEDFLSSLDLSKKPALVLLGELHDPHNVGAIIRSATAFGISGVLIPEHRQVPITGSVIKASAGMAFRIPLVEIGNVNRTLERLKTSGFWTYGLAGEATKILDQEVFDEPSVFVIGNEGKGIREKTEENCDVLLKVPISENVESLNASVSAAIVFYEWAKTNNKQNRP